MGADLSSSRPGMNNSFSQTYVHSSLLVRSNSWYLDNI